MSNKKGTFTDPVDGRTYMTIEIGHQVWMAENLNTINYRNGDPIPNVKDNQNWGNINQGAWCHYQNDSKLEPLYGKLYNWLAVNDPRGLSPEGWHIPGDSEWIELELFLGMDKHVVERTGWRGETVGGKLKEKGTLHWKEPNERATNECGFNARPGGYRDVDGSFYVRGSSGYWWSSTEHLDHFAWYRSLYFSNDSVHRTNSYAGDGFSIRCMKD